MMLVRSPHHHVAAALAAGLLLAACAAAPDPPAAAMPLGASDAELPPIPVCREEMVAFVEVNRLARTHGDGWIDFEPAIAALKRRILDCLAEDGEEL